MTKVGLYAIDKSTTLESNKSLRTLDRDACHGPLLPDRGCQDQAQYDIYLRPSPRLEHHRVMELCCALHNCRVRLTPWQPMV